MITSIKSWKQIKSFQLLYLYSKKAFVMIDMNEALQDYVKIKDRNKRFYSKFCRANKKYIEWIGNQHLDFYLPEFNIAIECQGKQHFYPVDFGNKGKKYAKEKLLYTKKLDNLKKEKCLNNGIKLIYYSNKKYNNSIISNKDEILKVINNAKF